MATNWNNLNIFQKFFFYGINYAKNTNYYLKKLLSKFIEIKFEKNKVKFLNSSTKTFHRIKSIYKKEILTIEWIKKFKKNSIFWDVGANIGIFSLYAACVPKVKVLSFEPMPSNYKNLCVNISTNKLSDKIIPFCLVLNDKNILSNLYVKWLEEGFSGTSFGKQLEISHKNGLNIKQFSLSIDTLVYKLGLPLPNYLKIDIDGNDFLVLKGAKKVLKNKQLRSIMIESPSRNLKNAEKKIKTFLKNYDLIFSKQENNNLFFEKKKKYK